MISGAEMAHLIEEFACSLQKRQDTEFHHHEQRNYVQTTFAQDVKSLKRAIEEMRNPYGETSVDLLVLNSRNIADSAVPDAMQQIEKLVLDHSVTWCK